MLPPTPRRPCRPLAEVEGLEEWARECSEHVVGQLADAVAELQDTLAAGSQDEQ